MLTYIILILAIVLLVMLLMIWYENQVFTVSHYTVTSERLPQGAEGTNFLLIADLHSNEYGLHNRKLIRKIDEISPDFIVVAGDLFVGREYEFDVAYELLKTLSSRYTIYYAYGNHEQKVEQLELRQASLSSTDIVQKTSAEQVQDGKTIASFMEYKQKIKDLGVHLLDNECRMHTTKNGQCIRIIGGTIDLEYFKRMSRPKMDCHYLNACFGPSETQEYQLLIAHNPMYFDVYAQWGADLVVSGHVHGGMVRLPLLGGIISPQMELFPKYDAGMFQRSVSGKESTLIVSRGLGIHTLKLRLGNRPELVHVTLQRPRNSQ